MTQSKTIRETRPYKAGTQMGESLVEMIHLMYQRNTALKYLKGLLDILVKEEHRRNTDDSI